MKTKFLEREKVAPRRKGKEQIRIKTPEKKQKRRGPIQTIKEKKLIGTGDSEETDCTGGFPVPCAEFWKKTKSKSDT